MNGQEIATLARLLLPYRAQVEAVWAGRAPGPGRPDATLLDLETVAARLSCSRSHVYSLIAAGELVRRDISVRGRPKTRVTAASVDDYIDRGTLRGVSPHKTSP